MVAEVFKTVALLRGDERKASPDQRYVINCVREGEKIASVDGREANCQVMDTTPITRYTPVVSPYEPSEFDRLEQVLRNNMYPLDSEPLTYSLFVPQHIEPGNFYPTVDLWEMARST